LSGSSIILDIVIDMNDAKLKTVARLKAFLDGSAAVDLGPAEDDLARYAHITARSHCVAPTTRRPHN